MDRPRCHSGWPVARSSASTVGPRLRCSPWVPQAQMIWSAQGALSAMAAGLAAWLLTLFLAPALPADFVGLGVSLLTMLVVTPLTQTIDPPRALVDSDGQPVEMTDRLGTLPLFARRNA